MPNPESVMLNLFQHQGRLVIQHFKNHGLRDPETSSRVTDQNSLRDHQMVIFKFEV
jgi:hypothetical protein